MTGISGPNQAGRDRAPRMPEVAARNAVGSLGWMSRGACQGEDPELFFPIAATGPAVHQISAAKQVCQPCTVRALCLAYALQARQAGVWGGTTPEERCAMRDPSRRHGGEQASPVAAPADRTLPGQPVLLPDVRHAVIRNPGIAAPPAARSQMAAERDGN